MGKITNIFGSGGGKTGGIMALVSLVMGGLLGVLTGSQSESNQPDTHVDGPQVQDLEFSTTEEGAPIFDLLGTSKFTGNVFWYENNRSVAITETTTTQGGGGKGGGGGGGSTTSTRTTGYNYYLTWAMGLCHGPVDAVLSIYQDNDLIWDGELTRPVDGLPTSIAVAGFGTIHFYWGTVDQLPSSVMARWVNETLLTGYRGLCWALMDDCLIGSANRAPSILFVLKKRPSRAFDPTDSCKDIGGYDYNPAHALDYLLAEKAGIGAEWLSEADFLAMAVAASTEQRGIGVLYSSDQDIVTAAENIFTHVKGLIRYGSDGKFHPRLIRSDWVLAELPVVDESAMLDDLTLERDGWIETHNEIKVQFSRLAIDEEPEA